MANEEQLSILKQRVEVWNNWREKNPTVEIDLSDTNLRGMMLRRVHFWRANLKGSDMRRAKLYGADFFGADLRGANLDHTNLVHAYCVEANLERSSLKNADLAAAMLRRVVLNHADLSGANLSKANLNEANLGKAILRGATLRQTDFSHANLGEADIGEANLSETNLSAANLSGANLNAANFNQTKLGGADFLHTKFGNVVLRNTDMSEVLSLNTVKHIAPSTVGIDTIRLSKGKISERFLRGCGLSDADIEYAKLANPELSNEEINQILYQIYELRATQALQISPLFVSYTREDDGFVDKIGDHLRKKGIRYWRDIHDMKAGKMEKQIDRAIRQNPTVLLVLSEHSLASDWVEHEVRTARALEKEMGRNVLCPIALDDSWKNSPWPKRIMEQIMEYNILDFSAWQDDSKFGDMFRKLIDGLELFYKG